MPRPDPKFTPGPWEIVPYGYGDSLVIHSSDENRVCFIATHGGTRSQWERIQENARLIAAAPDLYEAVGPLCPATDEIRAEFAAMDPDDTITITIPVRCLLAADAARAKADGAGQ